MDFIEIVPTEESLKNCDKNLEKTCTICGIRLKYTGALRLHRIKKHGIIENELDEPPFHNREKKFKARFFCPMDNCKYSKEKNLVFALDIGDKLEKMSTIQHQDKNVNCKERYFKSRSSLKQHYINIHMANPLVCRICRIVKFASEDDRSRHEQLCSKKIDVSDSYNPKTPNLMLTFGSTNPVIVVKRPTFLLDRTTLQRGITAPAHCRLIMPKTIRPIKNPIFSHETRDFGVQVDSLKQQNRTSTLKKCKPKVFSAQTETNAFMTSSSGVYDESACQTVNVETLGAGVQNSAPQMDIFCQTTLPMMQDVSVVTDLDYFCGTSTQVNESATSKFNPYLVSNFSDWASQIGDVEDDVIGWTTCDTETQTIDNNYNNDNESNVEDRDFAMEAMLQTQETQTYNEAFNSDNFDLTTTATQTNLFEL